MNTVPIRSQITDRVRAVSRIAVLRSAGAFAAVTMAVAMAAPVGAVATPSPSPIPTPTPTASPLPACTAPPLTIPCTPAITPPATPGGAYTLTLPGVGSLVFTVDPVTNQIVSASVSGLDVAFTASAATVDEDGEKVMVTFTSVANPTQVFTIVAKVEEPATTGGTPTVTAKVTAPEPEEKDEKDEKGEKKDDHKDAQHGQKGDEHKAGGEQGEHGDHGGHEGKNGG